MRRRDLSSVYRRGRVPINEGPGGNGPPIEDTLFPLFLNPYAYWRADQNIDVDIGPGTVRRWTDLTPNAIQLREANAGQRPFAVPNSALLNNRPVLRGEALNPRRMQTDLTSPSDWKFLTDGSGATVFIVAHPSTGTIEQSFASTTNAATDVGLTMRSTDGTNVQGSVLIFDGAQIVNDDDGRFLGNGPTKYICILSTGPAGTEVRYNFVRSQKNASTAFPAADPGFVFNFGGPQPSAGLVGDIAEICVFDRVLTDSEIDQLENYIVARYFPELRPTAPVPGIYAWCRMDLGIPEITGKTIGFHDLSGHHRHFSQTDSLIDRPSNVVAVPGLNNQPGVPHGTFQGVISQAPESDWYFLSSLDGHAICIVYQNNAIGQTGNLIGTKDVGSGGNGIVVHYDELIGYPFGVLVTSGIDEIDSRMIPAGPILSGWGLYTLGSLFGVQWNTVLIDLGSPVIGMPPTDVEYNLRTGRTRFDPTDFTILEILIWDIEFGVPQANALNAYLNARYT